MTHVLPLVEAFGPTLQGEGPNAGTPCSFLRLGGCNLSCSWCDSAYTWDASRFDLRAEMTGLGPAEIAAKVPVAAAVVVTGGEPLIHQGNPAWYELLEMLVDRFPRLHLETNGTIAPTLRTAAAFDTVSVSPKLGNAGPHKRSQAPAMDDSWARYPQAFLKVVCETELDVDRAWVLGTSAGFTADRIWVMPQGQTVDELVPVWPVVAQAAATLGINATHRLQVLAWGPERGH